MCYALVPILKGYSYGS